MATLLVIEDSRSQRAEIRAALEASAAFDRILEAEDGLHGLKLLLSESVDVVLCDLELPGLDGEKLLRMRTAARGGVRDPVHLPLRPSPTTTAGLGSCAAAPRTRSRSRSTAADLVARVELHLKLVRLQRELSQKNSLLEQLSTTDPLTGLRNRRYLTEIARGRVPAGQAQRTPLSVVMADIDHFKAINDRHGHAAGDAVLEGVGGRAEAPHARQRLRRPLRRRGVPASCSRTRTVDGARIFAERLRQEVEETSFASDSGPLHVTLSPRRRGAAAPTRRRATSSPRRTRRSTARSRPAGTALLGRGTASRSQPDSSARGCAFG